MFLWIDVRDLALAHTLSLQTAEAADKRLFPVAGNMCNKDIVEAAREGCPDLVSILPPKGSPNDMPPNVYGYDNSRVTSVLGLRYRSLKSCTVDTLRSLQAIEAGNKK